MEVIDKILLEWSYRCPDGIVDVNDLNKKAILDQILKENNIDLEEIGRPKKIQEPEVEPEQGTRESVLYTLKKIGVRSEALKKVGEILSNYDDNTFKNFLGKFRTYSIQDNIETIYDTFKDFYEIKDKGLGKGEVMMLIALKDSKSGGTASKDIEINGKIYEVKELATGEFSLAKDGYIGGTDYAKNLELLKKYLTPTILPSLDLNSEDEESVMSTINYYNSKGINNGSRGFINNLEKTCNIVKQHITKNNVENINYISVGDKRISVSDEDYYKIKSGSGPVSISFGEEIDEVKLSLSKLNKHPWINNPKLVKDNLNTIWDNFLKNINGMLIFKYPGADKGIFMDINEINSKFKPWRIVMNSLLAKAIITIKKEPQDIESEEENM